MKINDIPEHKIYREHTAGVPVDWKATQKGVLVTDQAIDTTIYTKSLPGDEVGWVYWHKDSRVFGAWGQIIPCVATDAAGSIKPLAGQGLGADSTFAAKTVVLAAATNDHSKARSISGFLPTSGELGFVVQCPNQDTFEQIWFPASSTSLKVDNTTPTTFSTPVYGVLPGGAIDPANVGKLDNVWYVESNTINIKDTASFRQDATKKGALTFQTSVFPTMAPPDETPYIVETKLAFNAATGKWRWYTQIGGGGESTTYARIAWNYDLTGDLSEAEIVTWNAETSEWVGSGTLVWISVEYSSACKFETAGTGTIFEVKLVTALYNRNGTVRDLYKTKAVYLDAGSKITHCYTTAKDVGNVRLICQMLARGQQNPVWSGLESAKIKTQIGAPVITNTLPIRLPEGWDITGSEDYNYLELLMMERGLFLYFRPIRPVKNDNEIEVYRSAETYGEGTIATYRRTN